MLALLKLIPIREYFYAAIAIAAVTYYNIHVHELVAKATHAQAVAVATATQKANAAAEANIAVLSSSYEANLKKVQDQNEITIQATRAADAADISRLRDLAASYQHANAVLQDTITTGPAGGPISSGSESLGTVPAELGAELAGALRATRDQRDLCYAERDEVTGK